MARRSTSLTRVTALILGVAGWRAGAQGPAPPGKAITTETLTAHGPKPVAPRSITTDALTATGVPAAHAIPITTEALRASGAVAPAPRQITTETLSAKGSGN
jgi:hypothetical protein